MLTQEKQDQVLWMADCYSLAKRFHDAHTWMSLLDRGEADAQLHPFHYWLWMEIWKAAQSEENPAAPPGQA